MSLCSANLHFSWGLYKLKAEMHITTFQGLCWGEIKFADWSSGKSSRFSYIVFCYENVDYLRNLQ